VRALILAAEVQSYCASSTSAPAGSVSLLTTALALAQLHYLDYLAALVTLHLANLQVDSHDQLLLIVSLGPSVQVSAGKVIANFCGRGCHVVSVTDPYSRILDFLDRSHYVSIK
jgi:hypothetical protein